MHDRTWELIQKHLDAESFNVMSCQESAPSVTDLRRVASDLGCVFPDEFIAHSCNEFGGLYVEVKEELWPRAKEFDVGPFWSFLYGFFTFNISEDIPEFMDLATIAREFQAETKLQAVPFMKIIGDADVYCFNATGAITRYDHELNELEEVNQEFFDLLDYELAELVDRKEQRLGEKTVDGELSVYNGVDCDKLVATLMVIEGGRLLETIRDVRQLAAIPLAEAKRALTECTALCTIPLAECESSLDRRNAIVKLEKIKAAIEQHGGSARIDLSLPDSDFNRVDCLDEELSFVKERLVQWG